jgi:putative spermidine/putrescine transport system permease protein
MNTTARTGTALPPAVRFFLLIPIVFFIGCFFWALFAAVGSTFVKDGALSFSLYGDLIGSSTMRGIVLRTIWVAATVTVLCAVIAYPVSQFIARSRHSNLLLIAVISPWLTSVVVRTFAWVVILGNKGVVNAFLMSLGLLDTPVRIIFTPMAVVIGLVHVFLPFMVISILAVLQQQDNSLREAGMSLGAGPFKTFAKVTFPLSLPGVISGSSIVYMLCSGAIVTPLLLGGVRDRMLGAQIYQELNELYDFKRAAGIATILLVTSLVVIIPLQMLDGRVRRWTKG